MDDRHPSSAAVISLLAALVAGTGSIDIAQAPAGRAFDATSIRPNTSPNAPPIAMLRGGRFFAPNSTLRDLIRVAYLVEDLQISGGPGWIDSDRFSIEATAAPGVSAEDARLMLRAMMADRFKLATHTEKRDLQGFSLVSVGRNKAQDLRPSGPQCAPIRAPAGIPAPPPPPPPPAGSAVIPMTMGRALSKCGSMIAGGYMSLRGISMEQLATILSQELRKPVIDRTNLAGPYDIDLSFLPEVAGPRPGPIPADATSLFTAVQEQLGLKLESQRVPTDVIVIDRVEKPSEN
jgi:uncharacterized protein (TIGR03435 family)